MGVNIVLHKARPSGLSTTISRFPNPEARMSGGMAFGESVFLRLGGKFTQSSCVRFSRGVGEKMPLVTAFFNDPPPQPSPKHLP